MKTEYEKAIDAQEPVAWITEGGDVTRSYALAVERSFNRAPLPLYLAPPAPSGDWDRALRMKPTPAMIGAAHDVTMKEAGIILSHELLAKIYEAMQAQAKAEPLTAAKADAIACAA